MDNTNCDESVYSLDKEAIHVEHDYCRAAVTCYTGEKKDLGLGEKCTKYAVEKWTDGRPVQVRNDNDRNKCTIPAVMGEVLSRASTIFRVPKSNNLSKGRKETSAETPLPAGEPEGPSEIESQNTSISEYETSSTISHRSAFDDSGMISQQSELSGSITPDLEFLRDVQTQPRSPQRLSPVRRSPACRQTITPVATCDTSIHSQPTQLLTGAQGLPDFQQAFGPMLQSSFSNSSSPPPSLTPHYPSSDTREGVFDSGTQCDDSNNASPPSLTPNYPLSDSERTVRADTSDTSEADVELATQYENSNCDFPPLFSSHERPVRADISDSGRDVNDLETQYENSNSNDSPPLFSTQNSLPLDNQETALTDTSVTGREVNDLETQYENSNSNDSPPLFSTQNSLPLDNQETALTDTSVTGWEVNDLETQYENSNSNGSPTLFSDTCDTRQGVIELDTRYENSNFSDSRLAQSTTSDPEFSDIHRVIDGETGYEYLHVSKVTLSAPTDLESTDTQRVIERENRYETENCLQLTGSTVSITEFLDTRSGVDEEDLTMQNRGSFRQDVNENLVARSTMTPKRKREEEPESLWTDEDYSQSGSPVLEIMSNTLGRLSKVAADSCAVSIGTNLSAPGFFTPAQNPENVNLDHSYSQRTSKSSTFRTLQSEAPESAEDAREEPVEIRSVREFSGIDASNLRRRVRKIGKRKIDFCDSKENRPAKRRRVRDETTRRSNCDAEESPDSGRPRANSNVRRESDRTGSIESSEGLLSNRCCEYDHIFPNVSSVDLSYEPDLLRHLVEPNYEAIKRKIDALMTRIETL